MGGFTPLHGQRDATVGWIISAVHPDPTPAMGAPEAEYVALNLQGDEGDSCRSAQGLQLKWNGHNRTLASDPCWPVGRMLRAEVSGLASLEGEWWWDGLDQQGLPAAPGMVVLDVRWTGPKCSGRKRSRFQVPGYGG